MPKRKIINIDLKKCNGCGLCIPNCPEGAIRVIDNKARLISDLFCDGLGACIGHCPQGAINIEERDAEEYDERKVMANIVKQGKNVIKAHLLHLKEHKQDKYFEQAVSFLEEEGIKNPIFESAEKNTDEHARHSGCPGLKVMDLRQARKSLQPEQSNVKGISELKQWPVQINLVPPFAPYLQGADLLIAADCVPFAYPDFHRDLLKGKILLIGCPKLDNVGPYQEKFTEIIKQNDIKSITYAHMEVPCCFGLVSVIRSAIAASSKNIPFKEITISINGEVME